MTETQRTTAPWNETNPEWWRLNCEDRGDLVWQWLVDVDGRKWDPERRLWVAAAPAPGLDALYRWEPVEGDCRRHDGPHGGFRCAGATGRYIALDAAEQEGGIDDG